jgi:ABC-type Fe3+/spermidine/putrescine transport system ATPase subunit
MDIQEKTGTTFIIVTHDQEEAMTVASRVAVMDEGRIVQVATPAEIYEAPNSVYVADFIGDVNLIRGTARARPAPAAEAAPPAEAAAPAQPDPGAAAPATSPRPDPQAPAEGTRAQPNARGDWLHDTLLHPLLGPRPAAPAAPRALPAPEPAAAPEAPAGSDSALPEGGIEIHWAEGQPPIIASNGDAALDGQPVTLALRPEKLTIAKTRPDRPNLLQGKVIDIGYLGNVSTYHVEIAGGTMVKAQMVNATRISRRDITWEDEVWVGFTATAGVVLAE